MGTGHLGEREPSADDRPDLAAREEVEQPGQVRAHLLGPAPADRGDAEEGRVPPFRTSAAARSPGFYACALGAAGGAPAAPPGTRLAGFMALESCS
jgi:hypothetical protein